MTACIHHENMTCDFDSTRNPTHKNALTKEGYTTKVLTSYCIYIYVGATYIIPIYITVQTFQNKNNNT